MYLSIIKDMKKVYPDLMKSIDKFRKTPEQNYLRLPDLENNEVSQRRLNFLRRFFAFQFTSGIMQNIAIQWVQCTLTVKDLQEQIEFNLPDDQKHPYRWYNGKIAYDHKKLREYFQDQSMIEKVSRYLPDSFKNEYDLALYEQELTRAQESFQPRAMILNDIMLDLQTQKQNRVLSDNEFDAVVETIKPYSKAVMKKIQDSIPDNVKAYLLYLCQGQNTQLNDTDRKRYEVIKKVIQGEQETGIQDYSDMLQIQEAQLTDDDFDIDLSTFQ